jgi:hypothetical protein
MFYTFLGNICFKQRKMFYISKDVETYNYTVSSDSEMSLNLHATK